LMNKVLIILTAIRREFQNLIPVIEINKYNQFPAILLQYLQMHHCFHRFFQ
jgi:hypothetical protein